MQLVLGLAVVAIATAPWFWTGPEDSSILPHAVTESMDVMVIFATASLLGAWVARVLGRKSGNFILVTAAGMVLGFAALALQSALAFSPSAFEGKLEAGTAGHLWVLLGAFIISQGCYFLMANLKLTVVALLVACLGLGATYWLQVVETLAGVPAVIEFKLWFIGPVVLGLVLGLVGFARRAYLGFWILSLGLQWIMPAVYSVVAGLIRSQGQSLRTLGSGFADALSGSVLHGSWHIPLLITVVVGLVANVIALNRGGRALS